MALRVFIALLIATSFFAGTAVGVAGLVFWGDVLLTCMGGMLWLTRRPRVRRSGKLLTLGGLVATAISFSIAVAVFGF
jgi:hypothetical protein